MSLIYGIKTQDGIYLAADTRLTFSDGTHQDNFAKFHLLGRNIALVAAGDAGLASYIVQKLDSSDLKDLPCGEFREKVIDFIREEIGYYPRIRDTKSVVFIVGAVDHSMKETLSMEKMCALCEYRQAGSNKSLPVRLLKPLMNAIIKAATDEKKGDALEIDQPYAGLYSIIVDIDKKEIEIKEVEWGEQLMFGPKGLNSEHAPKSLIVALDLEPKVPGSTKKDALFQNVHILLMFYKGQIIPKYDLGTVGGSVLCVLVHREFGILLFEGGAVIIDKRTGEVCDVSGIAVENGKICAKIYEKNVPLEWLKSFYKQDEVAGLDII